MKDQPHIDELLNSFLDGELTHHQHTEVQRMAVHDKHIARRLRRLEKCKILLGSLPSAEAPASMLEDIKASLEKRSLLVRQPAGSERSKGARHLMVRRLVTVAAMVGLVAVLAAVIYSILSPVEPVTDEPMVVRHQLPPQKLIVGTAKPTAAQFRVTLELAADDFVAADKFIRTAVKNNGLLDQARSPTSRDAKSLHSITCSRKDLNLLLTDLQNVWSGFDSATLFVDTGSADGRIVVYEVTAGQIRQIVNQHNFQGRIKAAKYFAVLNNISGLLPGQEPFTYTGIRGPDLTVIPRPVLTSGSETVKAQAARASQRGQISLTIVVTAAEPQP